MRLHCTMTCLLKLQANFKSFKYIRSKELRSSINNLKCHEILHVKFASVWEYFNNALD